MGRTAAIAVCCWCMLLPLSGCTRSHYRLKADREAYSLLTEKSACAPWSLPAEFSVYPDPRSRFYDQSWSDDPCLPTPSPQLYAYSLPELPDRDPSRFRPHHSMENAELVGPNELLVGFPPAQEFFPGSFRDQVHGPIAQVNAVNPNEQPVLFAYHQTDAPQGPAADALLLENSGVMEELVIVQIPEEVWSDLPAKCLARMFEFESVREEYERTFGRQPPEKLRDPSQRLTLEDIVQLAQINSREFQTEREDLYDTALALSLERYNYDLKFATGGNGTSPTYTHNRVAGITADRLAVPTTATSERVLATGGDFLARFANNVVLTFNGPDGFAADVGSSLLFDISQRIFQRDVNFELLTQTERRVVYAARDFGRARKDLFVGLAGDYYSLLLTYRAIEIATLDYFSNFRGFEQAKTENRNYRPVPQFQVDQFEQRALTSRRGLISACNALEFALDRLKIQIGLPPELPLNLDLLELEELTLRDEVTAAAERVDRARRRLQNSPSQPEQTRGVILNDTILLVTEALSLLELRQQRGENVTSIEQLKTDLALMRAEETRIVVRRIRQELNRLTARVGSSTPPPSLQVIERKLELVDSLLRLTDRELVVAERIDADRDTQAKTRGELQILRDRYGQFRLDVRQSPREYLAMEEQLLQSSDVLLTDAEGLALQADSLMPPRRIDPDGEMQQTLEQVDQLLVKSGQLLEETQGGLIPIEIDLDEAMLTALTLRYDVMTQREQLADAWRRLKLTGDDLKSVLNLNAAQTIRTRSDVNRPFDFTFDDSTTRLALEFDAPLNRKRQRNLYRRQLINYNQAFRNLMAVEDGIKFDIRNDLRQLDFRREQYGIAVASAALAYQRREGTKKEFQLDLNDIRARDVLDAQQDYTQSLVELASAHIDYIQRRITFFLNLELLQVDENQFWPELYDEQYQPTPSYELPWYAQPAYGQLPDRVLYSKKVQRMLHVPTGQSVIFRPEDVDGGGAETLPTPQPGEFPPPEEFRGPLPEPSGE